MPGRAIRIKETLAIIYITGSSISQKMLDTFLSVYLKLNARNNTYAREIYGNFSYSVAANSFVNAIIPFSAVHDSNSDSAVDAAKRINAQRNARNLICGVRFAADSNTHRTPSRCQIRVYK